MKSAFSNKWTRPSQYWLTYDTDVSRNRMDKKTGNSSVCRNGNGRIINKYGTMIGDPPILIAETFGIQEALKHAV